MTPTRHRNSFLRVFFYLLACAILLSGACKRKANSPKPELSRPTLSEPITQVMERQTSALVYPKHSFKAFQGKAKMQYQSPEEKLSATLHIHIAPDSLIWISVTPALGIEIIRCLFRPDSVFIMDRYNKEVHFYTYKQLSRLVRAELGFSFFQAMILGENPWGIAPPEKTEPDTDGVLETRFRYPVEALSKRDTNFQQISSFRMQNLNTGEKFFLGNSEHKTVGNLRFPYKKFINMEWISEGVAQEATISLHFSKAAFTEQMPAFNFNIPEGYKRGR
jgi:Domain of unknown function (DUF4292)